jgi:hypothetical protein
MAALPGLALLECGVPAKSPEIQKVAKLIRTRVPQLNETYKLALAILFLDRLGDPQDRQAIQTLALRLVAGQRPSGGWTYNCPRLEPRQEHDLLFALQKQPPASPLDLPPQFRNLPALQPPSQPLASPLLDAFATNNSTTQFAILGLWAARRHNLPLERALALVAQRFRVSQAKGGGWGYMYEMNSPRPTPSMTGAGLLGLAVGHGLMADSLSAAARAELAQDPAIQKGLKVLSESVGKPLGKYGQLYGTPETAINLYLLWALERVGMVYNRQSINGKEWYTWGVGQILANQEADGSWSCGGYAGSLSVTDTCFALLFLKRANLTRDLTEKLQEGAKGPG